MKKIIALVMALMLMATLVACGGTDADNSADNSSKDDSAPATVSVADFEGVWKITKGEVDVVEISADDKSVTAYTADGFVIATFPVAETAEGLVLKMGAFGEVTLEDAASLTTASAPAPADKADIKGDWEYIWGDLPEDTVLSIEDERFTISGTKSDSGTYIFKDNDTVGLSPTKELGGIVTHEILGGGNILNATDPSVRYYVKKSALSTDTGKAIKNYFELFANEWKDADGAIEVEFKDNGALFISGSQMGIWYPTATGASIEYQDGTKDDITVADGKFNLPYYGKDFSK